MAEARDNITLLRPEEPSSVSRGASSGFPSDLFEQARGRLRLLAGFFLAAFSFDLLIFTGLAIHARFSEGPAPAALSRSAGFQWLSLGAALLSMWIWWAARSPRISAARMHTFGLVYQTVVCFTSAILTYWQYYLDTGLIPNLTWIPAIVLMFPLIMPGPPRKMLVAAIAAGAMGPVGLALLELAGKVDTKDGSGYVPALVGSTFAVVFAHMGSRVIYGMGREVARARAMGSYQLEEKLGEGGMGEVWRAKHRMLARTAAVKLIRPSLSGNVGVSHQARHRFEREAQAIARLRSPHTVDLFDFGVADDGAFYYAMEMLDGLDADALVRRYGPMPAERVVFVLAQVCHSLSEAESCGLVHRDIKPSNIFLCRYGEDYDFVKVLDFGIVKAVHDGSDSMDTALTGENVIHGTPAFMAPEQALGKGDVDGRADLYSLGCVAYWLLTGQLVFEADKPTAMLMQHIQTPPVAPSARTELPIPAALDAIVLSCLAKSAADRPSSARELARRLAAVDGASAWTPERCRDWWEKHRPAAVSG